MTIPTPPDEPVPGPSPEHEPSRPDTGPVPEPDDPREAEEREGSDPA